MGPIRDVTQAAQAVESCLLRQLIETSGAFKGSEMAGSQIHAHMFVDALADAVEKGGGIGLARLIEKSLPNVVVLSYREVAAADSVRSVATVKVSHED